MYETLSAFHARVDGFMHHSLPEHGGLTTREPLREKVSPDGQMLPFFGNTMIYELPQQVKLTLADMQLALHHRAGFCLAQPLPAASLHLTLHDLLNGTDETALADGIARTGKMAQALLTEIRREGRGPVHLTSVRAFNMVNGSAALGFAPDTEEDCTAIMALHARFQQVVTLSYPLTPHVTLAYYRPGCYGMDAVHALDDAFRTIAQLPPVHLALSPEQLFYRRFRDMLRYE